MNILKRMASVSGPVMRVLMGIGALGLLIVGLKQEAKKKSLDIGSRRTVPRDDKAE
jgi:hypothetical protein